MGGPGSGRWNSQARKKTTDLQLRVDIYLLNKKNCLRPGLVGSFFWSIGDLRTGSVKYEVETARIILRYWLQSHGIEQYIEQEIDLVRTDCNYGGQRTWFQCPRCQARVAVLYCITNYFICRKCCGLAYKSQYLTKSGRLLQKARNIRKRLGGGNNLVAPFPSKPKFLHWKTYLGLCKRSEYAAFYGIVGKR